MVSYIDMVIETGAALLPFRIDVGFMGQRLQCRFVQRFKQGPAAGTQVPGDLVVQGRVASITGQARSTLTRENGQPTDSNLAQPSSVILLRARTPICASVF